MGKSCTERTSYWDPIFNFHMRVRINCRCKSVKKKRKNCEICMKGTRRRLTQELNV